MDFLAEAKKLLQYVFLNIIAYKPDRVEIDVSENAVARVITISGFNKKPTASIKNRFYAPKNIKITPKWEKENKIATKENWPIHKINSDNFFCLPESIYGIEPRLVEVIYDDSELGELKLKYNFLL